MKVPATQALPVVFPRTEVPHDRAAAGRSTPRTTKVVLTEPAAAAVAAAAPPSTAEPPGGESFADRLRRQVHLDIQSYDDVSISVDRDSGRIIVKLVDPESGEVTRQIPPDEVLKMARKLRDLQPGQLVNEKA